MANAELFTIAKRWKQPGCSSTGQTEKLSHTNKGVLFSHKEKETLLLCDNMAESEARLCSVGWEWEDKYCTVLLTRGSCSSQIHRSRGKRMEAGTGEELGATVARIQYFCLARWLSFGELLCSTMCLADKNVPKFC